MNAVTLWIWFCAYLNCVGWILSCLHELNARGYAIALALGLALVVIWHRKTSAPVQPRTSWPKLRRRFRRGFPLSFLVLALLAFLGGALHAPANYDALAYRTPRVLHWLAAGHWHWIHTEFQRLNTRTAGFEWLTAPLFLFTGTDRLVFLLNVISFLLLPGRIFALLTRLGVRPRTAWYWMWLFPSGYGYALQAGSVVNDMFGALLTLAALEFALRASREKEAAYLWTSLLAAALMTAAKAFNLLLLLPWLLAALPALKLLLRRPAVSFAVIVFAATASLLPTAVLNWQQCRDWTGLAAEQPTIGGSGKPYRFLANAITLPLDNLVPPVFPLTSQWDHLMERIIPSTLATKLRANMETSLASFHLSEMQMEESAGLGLGLTLLLLVLLARSIRSGEIWPRPFFTPATWITLGAWCSLVVFMLQVGSAGPARYLLPFYPLLVAPILASKPAEDIFRSRLWRGGAWAIFASTAMLLVISPPRPLWPATTVLQALGAEHSSHRLVQRAEVVYSVYGMRANGFIPVIAALPPDANPLGFLGFDEPETGLWRPFGSRRIIHFTHEDTPAELQSLGFKYALVSESTLANWCRTGPADWLARTHVEVVQRFKLKLLAGQEPHGWLLIRLR